MDKVAKTCYFIGITGRIGSGKTSISNILRANNYFVFDSDSFSKRVLSHDIAIRVYLEKIVGRSITLGESIDFKLLGKFFDDNPRLEEKFEAWYQKFLGKKILEKMLILGEKQNLIFLDIPLLQEKGIANKLDYLWIVESDLNKCYERVKFRNNYCDEKIEYLIKMSQVSKELLSRPSTIIYNNEGIQELEAKVRAEIYQLQRHFHFK